MARKTKLPIEVNAVPTYKPSKADIERERRYRAEDAIRALQRAEDIKKDKDLMRDCKQYAKEQIKTLGKI